MDEIDLPQLENWIRLPGLFKRWELEQVLKIGGAYLLADGGAMDGTPLVCIYEWRPAAGTPDAQASGPERTAPARRRNDRARSRAR